MKVHEAGMSEKHSISLYPGTGSVNGTVGDHVLVAPAFNVTKAEVELIVELVRRVIEDVFSRPDIRRNNER